MWALCVCATIMCVDMLNALCASAVAAFSLKKSAVYYALFTAAVLAVLCLLCDGSDTIRWTRHDHGFSHTYRILARRSAERCTHTSHSTLAVFSPTHQVVECRKTRPLFRVSFLLEAKDCRKPIRRVRECG